MDLQIATTKVFANKVVAMAWDGAREPTLLKSFQKKDYLSYSVNIGNSSEVLDKSHQPLCCAFSADGQNFATGGFDGKVKIWGTAKGTQK